MVIAVDFDGTCVTHEFPMMGKDIGAVPVLRELIDNGHQIILYTMRSDIDKPKSKDGKIVAKGGNYLTQAVKWFKDNGIPLHGVNTNPDQRGWTTSPKCYAELYIDDAALGCPLKYEPSFCSRPFVDWEMVREFLFYRRVIKNVSMEKQTT